jgi:hypothetical protein
MNGFAALALVASVSSCTKDVTAMSQGEIDEKSKENAELQLGLRIPDGQTWNMASQVEANVSVNLGLDQEYTVAVYDKNPLYDSSARFYTMGKVQEGGSFNASITLPTAAKTVYIATYDSKNRSVVNTVNVENGKIVANIGGSGVAAKNRAVEDASVYPDYVKTLDNYLNPASVVVYGNNFTVANISLEGMASYTALTDAIITGDTSQGNHTLSDKNSNPTEHFPGNGDGKHYRVAADTEITEVFNINGTYGVINDAVIYIEGTVHLNGNTLNGPTLVVAPGGKIILDGNTDMSNAGRIVVMAGGSIEAAENVTPTFNVNNGAACYNAGTIDFDGQLNVNGSDTYNKGTITVDVLRNTSGGKFTNFGHITARTNMQAADSYNSTIINGCYMHFTEDAGIGTLTLLDNSRLEVDGRAEFNQATQTLYNLSEIKAGAIYINSTKFAGPTASGSFAIVKTETVWANQGADLSASGNIYFDWNPESEGGLVNHQGVADFNSTVDNGYTTLSYIKGLNLNYTTENSSTLIIPKGDCTGMGYNPGGGGGKIYGDPAVYTYAFEDQTLNTDYDMNDVVLKVSYVVKEKGTGENAGKVIYDKTQLKVQLVAAGATYEIKAKIGNAYLFDGKEIHLAMGQNKGMMINTGGTGGNSVSGVAPAECTVAAPAGWNGKFEELPVSIEVSTTNKTYAFPNNDIYPHVVMIPVDWAWPTERTNIKDAYPGSGTNTVTNKYTATYTNKETNELVTAEFTNTFLENSFAAWATSTAAERVGNGWYNSPSGAKTMKNN